MVIGTDKLVLGIDLRTFRFLSDIAALPSEAGVA